MPLFLCDRCDAVENTALGRFWVPVGEPRICSACSTGKWHGLFPQQFGAEAAALIGVQQFIHPPELTGGDPARPPVTPPSAQVAGDIEVPRVPNFLRVRMESGFVHALGLEEFSDEQLQQLGADWTVALLTAAARRRQPSVAATRRRRLRGSDVR
jgi:hypothetical protein